MMLNKANPLCRKLARIKKAFPPIVPGIAIVFFAFCGPSAAQSGDKYFSSPIELWISKNPVAPYYVVFNPTDTKDYAYEVQLAGKDAVGNWACLSEMAGHIKQDDLKGYDVSANVNVGINGKQPTAGAGGSFKAHVDTKDAFGREVDRNPVSVFREIHFRVRVLDGSRKELFKSPWNRGEGQDIAQWDWAHQKPDCKWVAQ
jgi:hypothetical protein